MAATQYGVITLAYGRAYYVEMAKTLARSLRLHSPNIPLAIVTDCQEDEELSKLFDYVLPLKKEYGSNMIQKLHLNKYSPFQRTLYIDSDCIAVRDISFIFKDFEGMSFGAVGDAYLVAGQKDNFIDVDAILKKFGLDKLPKFNGGVYYFDKSKTADAIFETALEILRDWKSLGIAEVRGDGPNDERIVAIAMMLHHQNLLDDDGEIMRTPIGLRGSLSVDALTGKSCFQKYDKVVSPALVHFACVWAEHPVYHRNVTKLKNLNQQFPVQQDSGILSWFKYQFGYQIALIRYIVKRVPKNPKYVANRVVRLLT